MTLEEGSSPKRTANHVNKGASPKGTPKLSHAQGAMTELENKLIDVQRENKDLQKEIKLLQRIQDR